MPGNELNVCKFLLENLNKIQLSHLGTITKIELSTNSSEKYQALNLDNYLSLVSPNDSRKKADIYLNNKGVSIKQTGGSFSFNRLQRAEIMSVFHTLNFSNPETILNKLDLEINNYHQGILSTRNICWSDFFSASYFQKLLQFLMMQGSPNYGLSKHPADYLLEAPAANINQSNLNLYTFEEYFQL